MSLRPRIGIEVLLVYRECPCGEWCATGEGSTAPICRLCGGEMCPVTTGETGDYRRRYGLGFRAALANEIALAEGKTVYAAVRKALVVYVPHAGDRPRYYEVESLQGYCEPAEA